MLKRVYVEAQQSMNQVAQQFQRFVETHAENRSNQTDNDN